MKKIAAIFSQVTTFCLLGSSVFANAGPGPMVKPVEVPQVNYQRFTGWFVGAQLGYAYTIIEYPCIVIDTGVKSFDRHNTQGVVGGLHGGYGYQFKNSLYLGLEATADLYSNHDKLDSGNGNDLYKHKVTNSFAINPRLGIALGECCLLYGKIGVEFTRWKHSIDHNVQGIFGSSSKYKVGIAPGIGISYFVAPHVMVGVEGTYVFYGKKTKFHNLNNTDHILKDRLANFKIRASYKI